MLNIRFLEPVQMYNGKSRQKVTLDIKNIVNLAYKTRYHGRKETYTQAA